MPKKDNFDWQISDDFKKIELIDEQELFDRIRYSCEQNILNSLGAV